MESLSIDILIERAHEVINDRYVNMMYHIYRETDRVLGQVPSISFIYAYTIARALYPRRRWSIRYDSYHLYLIGRDVTYYTNVTADIHIPSTTICDSHTLIDIIESEISTILADKVQYLPLSVDVREESMYWIPTHRIYSSESPLYHILNEDTPLSSMIRDIIDSDRSSDVLSIDLGGVEYLMYTNILLYHLYNILVSIFNNISPSGCPGMRPYTLYTDISL